MVVSAIANDPQIAELTRRLNDPKKAVSVSGLWGSSAPMVAARVAQRISRPVLYVTAHLEQADDAREDLEFFLGRACELLSAWETLPGEGAASAEIHAERNRLCTRLADHDAAGPPLVLVAPIQALMQPVPSRQALADNTLQIKTSQAHDPDELARWLLERGFERLPMVEAPGDFARRGDILDVFCPGDTHPLRLEFFGDHVESIRRFDVSNQRSIETLSAAAIRAPGRIEQSRAPKEADENIAARSSDHSANNATDLADTATIFFDYLPPNALVILDGPAEVQEMGELVHRRLGQPKALFDVHHVLKSINNFGQLHLARFGGAPADHHLHFKVGSLTRFEGKAAQAAGELVDLARSRSVIVVCENEGERRRLRELLAETAGDTPASIDIQLGYLHRGFEWMAANTVIVAHHEVFNRARPWRRIRRAEAVRPLETWMELAPGDLVVHSNHGIARFRRMKPMRKGDTEKIEEFLELEFADKAVLHVATTDIDLVQKYVGVGAARPRLSKLGGTRWSKTKEKVSQAVSELAESLIRIQAARMANPGIAYPDDTQWQHEFEDAFPYQETEDQTIVAEEIKNDLRRSRPMDRLLCGDVGYGKTELAMRAGFKVVEYGKQVAILVPTTVLAEQHFRTFSERMSDYPFAVACLSRFRSPREQREIIQAVKKGQVDVVIGTHRLLSRDVGFADLGLVIIDEEQRFGVEHKERLKQLRDTVDVLTMTATPIPRTLHMSMIGIRDISSLATPPVDRRSIATQVGHFDEQLIRNAILREMNRDGQVYFIHNFVRSIEGLASRIQSIVPEARIIFGHGQMAEGELERVMRRFVNREADVLVATTIIESGIDIASANTIFINNADRFGLADLHQLRGRVGRSRHRAYCYLLIAPDRPLTDKAARRLKSIEEFSDLGAGFQIAMRDLEIRGAGNILGPEQSGHIAAVGYDMYCKLLDQSARSLRNEPDPAAAAVHLEIGVSALVPKSYIPSERSRIDVYRRTVACKTPEDLRQLEADIIDAFGPFPPQVGTLLEMAEIRVLARPWKIHSIVVRQPDIVFTIRDLAWVQPLFEGASGTVRMPDPQTVHLRLRDAYFEPPTLLACLRRLLSKTPAATSPSPPDRRVTASR